MVWCGVVWCGLVWRGDATCCCTAPIDTPLPIRACAFICDSVCVCACVFISACVCRLCTSDLDAIVTKITDPAAKNNCDTLHVYGVVEWK